MTMLNLGKMAQAHLRHLAEVHLVPEDAVPWTLWCTIHCSRRGPDGRGEL